MRIIYLITAISIFFHLPLTAAAQRLTVAECAQIRATYGVIPAECREVTDYTPASILPRTQLTEPTHDMRQNNIFFTQSGSALDSSGLLQIQRLADFLNAPSMQNVCLKLVGHSDTSGSAALNLEMGAKRATAVQTRLSILLLSPGRIEGIQSLGEEQPLAGLPPNSKWQRRVTIMARDCPRYQY